MGFIGYFFGSFAVTIAISASIIKTLLDKNLLNIDKDEYVLYKVWGIFFAVAVIVFSIIFSVFPSSVENFEMLETFKEKLKITTKTPKELQDIALKEVKRVEEQVVAMKKKIEEDKLKEINKMTAKEKAEKEKEKQGKKPLTAKEASDLSIKQNKLVEEKIIAMKKMLDDAKKIGKK